MMREFENPSHWDTAALHYEKTGHPFTARIASWQDRGAATFLLLGQVRRKLFPERGGMTMPEAVTARNNPQDFAREFVIAGYGSTPNMTNTGYSCFIRSGTDRGTPSHRA